LKIVNLKKKKVVFLLSRVMLWYILLTATTESLAATARISAQETTPGHKLSNSDLMLSITPKPLMEFTLGPADCSPVKLDVSFNSTDASHPWTN